MLLALSFATKETTFITLFVAGTFFLAVLVSPRRDLVIAPVRAVGRDAWGWGLACLVGVYTILFTTFLTNPEGVQGLYTGLDYWLGQHEVGRGGESRLFYSVILTFIEVPAFVFLGIWALQQLLNGYLALGDVARGEGVAWFAHIGGFALGILCGLIARSVRARAVRRSPEA